MLKRKLQQLPFSEFAQISRAKRLKFSQKSADDTRFTQPGSQNAILERKAQIIINFYPDLSKGGCRNCENKPILLPHKLKEKLPSPPLCFGHTTANHLPTAQCGLTLIGDQKQIIIQLYTGAGKIANEGMLYCKISLNKATNSNCS